MSDYSSVAPPQNFNKSQAFAAALQRAKQIAAKINPGGASDGGTKRSLDDGPEGLMGEPDAKKLARGGPGAREDQGGQPPRMGVPPGGPGGPLGVGGPGASGGGQPPPAAGGPVTSEDIKVPDKMVGLSRGGEQITRLQSESGCKIQMAPDSGGLPDRVCTLTGNAPSINRAKELINSIVHQRYKTEGPGGGSRGMEDMMQQPHTNPSFVEVMIPGPKVGLIIGKGGETIKNLQEKSGAKMVVIQEGPNQEAEKPLRITGDPQKVEHAKTLVYELLAEKENQFAQRREQHDRGGRGVGQGGRGGYNDRGGPGRGGPGGQGGFRGPGHEESTYVVPASKCGVIIGRGGETIKQINQSTGAHCELDRRPGNNPNEKIFIIRGTPEQIEAAKQMISEKLGNLNQHGAGGGGGMAPNANGYPGGPQQYGQNRPPQPQYQQPYQNQMGPGGGPGGGGMGPNANGYGGGPPQYGQNWGAPAPYQQPYHNQMDPSAAAAAGGGAAMGAQPPDYSAQWIEYYRSLGMHQEADAIEQQTKAKQAAAGGGGAAGVGSGGPQGQGGAGGQQNGAAAPGGAQPPDYSAQWAQYYRSIGKIKEAELIEHQMKTKQQGGVVGPGGGGAPAPGGFGPGPGGAPAPAAPAAAGYYPPAGAGGGFYPPGGPGGYQYPGQPGQPAQPHPGPYPYQPQPQPQDNQQP